jgi:hypothetical protein
MRQIVKLVSLLLALYATEAFGAIAESNSPNQRAGYVGTTTEPSATVGFPLNVSSGCMQLVGGVSLYGSSVTVTSLRATFDVLYAATATPIVYFIARGISTTSGADSVTVTPDVDGYISFGIDEFCGVDSAAPLDVDGGTSTGVGTAAPADSITTGVADTLVVGVYTTGNTSPSITPDAGWTEIYENEDSAISQPFSLIFAIKSGAPATYSVSWTLGDVVDWAVMTNSFKPPAIAAVVRHRQILQ